MPLPVFNQLLIDSEIFLVFGNHFLVLGWLKVHDVFSDPLQARVIKSLKIPSNHAEGGNDIALLEHIVVAIPMQLVILPAVFGSR